LRDGLITVSLFEVVGKERGKRKQGRDGESVGKMKKKQEIQGI
jgi:hypothetical protein